MPELVHLYHSGHFALMLYFPDIITISIYEDCGLWYYQSEKNILDKL